MLCYVAQSGWILQCIHALDSAFWWTGHTWCRRFFGQYTLVHSDAFCRPTPSVCPWQFGALRKRWEIGLRLLWTAYYGYKAIQGPIHQPLRPPFPQTEGSQPPVKTCIANCGQTVPDTMMVYTDSLWEHTITLPNSTIVDGRPLRAPFPPKRGSQKIKLKAAASAKS